MTAKLRFFWVRLNSNYWFYPTLFAILAAVLGVVMVLLDQRGYAGFLSDQNWIIPVGPKGASDILTVMAGALIGVAGTVFSITLVAVTYASSTYGPRLLTNFMEDKGNQISLATFIAAFVYALVVLRSVRVGEDAMDVIAGDAGADAAAALPGFAPQMSILVAYILMGACIAVLVFFLNHVPSSIRINTVLERIGRRLIAIVHETYPDEDTFREAIEPLGGKALTASKAGYVQLINFDDLKAIARDCGCTISLRVRTGDFVHRDLPFVNIMGCPPDGIGDAVRACLTLGATRTRAQDPEFLIDQLVEIGLRALSPGINDPFTAITAMHWLGAAMAELGHRDLRKNVCGNDTDDCPIIPLPDDFTHYLQRSFGTIRSAASSSPNAALVMLEALGNAAMSVRDSDRLEALREHGQLLIEQAREALAGPDLAMVEDRHREFDKRFGA